MKRTSLLVAGLLALSCQRTTGAEPAPAGGPAATPPESEPAPAPTPIASVAPSSMETPDAGAVAAAAPDAAAPDAAPPPAPACTPVAKPPVIDVYLRFSTGKANLGPSMPAISALVAKVAAPSVKLSHEIWSSPAPTSCSARAEGDEMRIECITDEGQLKGRVHIDGEQLVVDAVRGLPLLPMPAGATRPKAADDPTTREVSVKVPCGARLRVHPAARDYR